jgi:acyl-CoA dehydrogenase
MTRTPPTSPAEDEGANMTDTALDELRTRTRALCAQFPDEYWRETDRNRRYPQEFVDTLTGAGLLAALIPTE